MRAVSSFELDDFRVHLKTFDPLGTCRWSDRVPGRLCVFIEGGMKEGSRRYETSDLVYKPPEDRPLLKFGRRGAKTVTVELRERGLQRLSNVGFEVGRARHLRSNLCHALALRVHRELSAADDVTPLVLEGLVLDLFSQTYRRGLLNGGRAPVWLEAVRESIERNYRRPWTLRHYAGIGGVHPAHLATRFRAAYGDSVGGYLRTQRVRSAMRELSLTRTPICEVALSAGFCDQSHLNRVFKKSVGMTPDQFRSAGL